MLSIFDWLNPKDVEHYRSTSDKLLVNEPVLLLDAVFLGAATGSNFADLYDGISTSGVLMVELAINGIGTVTFSPRVPLWFYKGLYYDETGSGAININLIRGRRVPRRFGGTAPD